VNSSTGYLTENFPPVDELYISFYIKINALPASSVRIAEIHNGSPMVGNILLTTSGKLRLRSGSTTIGADSASLSIGTIYRVGLHQKKGGGSNAVLEAYFVAGDAPFGSAFATNTAQSFTNQASSFRFGATNGKALNAQFDNIRLDAAVMP
jgi:hypothetical protein